MKKRLFRERHYGTKQEENKETMQDILKMKKDELLLLATEKGIKIPNGATKQVIINLIKEG